MKFAKRTMSFSRRDRLPPSFMSFSMALNFFSRALRRRSSSACCSFGFGRLWVVSGWG
jgi:hypothetical protein